MYKFDKIEHFAKFPCMVPFVGQQYSHPRHKKLLVVGESHYLSSKSTIHLDDKEWYSTDQRKLTEKEIGWIDPNEIITYGIDTNFSDKGLKIYHEIAQCLNDVLFKYQEWHEIIKVIHHISFINYFQRPAPQGESLDPTEKDIQVSDDVISSVIKTLNPDLIAIVSSKSASYAAPSLVHLKIPYCITPHPACAWWNRKAKKYGDRNGYEVLKNFLLTHWIV